MATRSTLRLHTGNRIPVFGLGTCGRRSVRAHEGHRRQQLFDGTDQGATGEVPVVDQLEWTPFGYSPEMPEAWREQNIVMQAYSPSTRGTEYSSLGDAALL